MTNSENKFYITTPIYYASGKPHIGHAYTTIATDVLARWNRTIGKEVYFLTGTDEHGQKIVESGEKINKTPKEFVDIIVPQFKNLFQKLNISNDYFIRTTDESHKSFVQKMLQKAYDNGDIYLGKYEGLYCVGCEQYYTEDELENGTHCPTHKTQAEKVSEENYFFKLSKYEDKLLKFYEKTDFLQPKSRAQETINRVKEGLQDISISRNKNKLSWGIELPFDNSHVTYVWFDALFNYVSALNTNNKMDFWPANFHIIGKDIKWFHEVYWPAFLLSVGLDLPKKVFTHGMILDGEGHKMSKSLGNVIDPIKFTKKFGVDEFRYFMIAGGSFGEDLNFGDEIFAVKINNELNNDLGNLISRTHAMTNKYFPNGVPKIDELKEVDTELLKHLNIFDKFNNQIQNLEYNKAFETLWTAIRETNAYVNKVAPWKEQDQKRLGTTLNILCSASILFGKFIECIMPEKATLLFKQFNIENNNIFKLEFLNENHKLGEKQNLFEKIKLEKPQQDQEKQKEGFEKLNLKVGQISEVKKHPESDKLYIIQVDLKNETRQILSGLQQLYTLKELENRKVIVITNLKPAKLGGYDSNGMILACEDEDHNCGLLNTDLEIGTNLVCNNQNANNEKTINSKAFKKIIMKGNNGKATYENKEIQGIEIDKKINGTIC